MPKAKPGTKPGYPPVVPRRRYANDNPVPETGAEGQSPTLMRRLLDEVIPRAKDQRLASELGRLHLRGVITEQECEAGMEYAEIVGRHDRLKGVPRRTAKSQSYDFGFNHGGSDIDPSRLEKMDPETAEKVKQNRERKIRKAEKAKARIEATIPGLPIHIATVVDAVCLSDEPVHSSWHGVLRTQLQRFMVHLGKGRAAAKKQEPKRTKKSDLVLLAEAAVEAMTAWFLREKAQIQAFEVGPGKHKARRLFCSGVRADMKTAANHAVEIKLKGAIPAAIDAQLVKAAQAQGWHDMTDRPMPPVKPKKIDRPVLTAKGGM